MIAAYWSRIMSACYTLYLALSYNMISGWHVNWSGYVTYMPVYAILPKLQANKHVMQIIIKSLNKYKYKYLTLECQIEQWNL